MAVYADTSSWSHCGASSIRGCDLLVATLAIYLACRMENRAEFPSRLQSFCCQSYRMASGTIFTPLLGFPFSPPVAIDPLCTPRGVVIIS